MATYIANAFSLSMVNAESTISTRPVNLPAIAHKLINPISIVGHEDTAAVFSGLLGIQVNQNRQSITLNPGDNLYVGQLIGGRLPEGATSLPENFGIKWLLVTVDGGEQPMERTWTEGGSSMYGGIDRQAKDIAEMVGGNVKLMQDAWGNPHWNIEAPGFSGNVHDD